MSFEIFNETFTFKAPFHLVTGLGEQEKLWRSGYQKTGSCNLNKLFQLIPRCKSVEGKKV